MTAQRCGHGAVCDYVRGGGIYSIGGYGGGMWNKTDAFFVMFTPLLPPTLHRKNALALFISPRFLLHSKGMTYHASVEWLNESRSEWRSVAPMRVARTGPAVGMGFDGCVYVAGGSPNGSSSHRTAERYDPRSGTWDALPRMSIGRGYCSGAMGISGDFYVTGGITSGPSAMEIQAIEAFDIAAGKWRTVRASTSMNQPRADHSCVFVDFPETII